MEEEKSLWIRYRRRTAATVNKTNTVAAAPESTTRGGYKCGTGRAKGQKVLPVHLLETRPIMMQEAHPHEKSKMEKEKRRGEEEQEEDDDEGNGPEEQQQQRQPQPPPQQHPEISCRAARRSGRPPPSPPTLKMVMRNVAGCEAGQLAISSSSSRSSSIGKNEHQPENRY